MTDNNKQNCWQIKVWILDPWISQLTSIASRKIKLQVYTCENVESAGRSAALMGPVLMAKEQVIKSLLLAQKCMYVARRRRASYFNFAAAP